MTWEDEDFGFEVKDGVGVWVEGVEFGLRIYGLGVAFSRLFWLDMKGLSDGVNLLLPYGSSYLNSRFLGYVTIGYIEPSSNGLSNWEP